MKKYLIYAAGLLFCLAACDKNNDDDKPTVCPSGPATYAYVLNSGRAGSNNASLSRINLSDTTVEADIFKSRNNRSLGDLANDMIRYGGKLYITLDASGTIEVTDLDGNSLKQILTGQEPRRLAALNGYVYVTYFAGEVAKLDTASLQVVDYVKVGCNPDQIVAANGKLYVANTGGMDYAGKVDADGNYIGYDKTVSVIDPADFTETKQIEVALNPGPMAVTADGSVYVVSLGNYQNVPNTVQRIDTQTDTASPVDGLHASELFALGHTLYIMYGSYDANWNPTYNFFTYDTEAGAKGSDFLADTPANPYKMDAALDGSTVFVSSSDYTNNGDVSMYDLVSGKFEGKWEVGMNPVRTVVVSLP
ncbi:MAG: hypothetical protein LBL81_04535 [Tannerella sp.]|jgi:hypothetical protein|nr:hypothetical protein [Tannerella sp.]